MPKMRLAALGAALVTVLAAYAASASASPRATLTLRSKQPISVAGAHFYAREWVRVSAQSQSTLVRATVRGTFVVKFPGLALDRCSGISIRAAGTRGTRAVLRLPRPACLPARSP